MIILDTHIWRWWVNGDPRFKPEYQAVLDTPIGLERGVSVISCWEIAKSVESGKLVLSIPVEEWIGAALRFPGVVLLNLTPDIAVESTRLPGPIHRDPGDQMIIATARILGCPLLTADEKILSYRDVNLAWKP